MQGEDYRSQALVNYHKILELQEVITFVKAEPSLWKERYTALLTQLRRETERHKMLLEDKRQEILALMQVIDKKDYQISQLDLRHDQDMYLVEVMRNRIQDSRFDVAHIETQFSPIMYEMITQTEYPDNHVGIQAHGFNLQSAYIQTDPIVEPSADDLLDQVHMPQKKIKKKKQGA